MRKGIFPSRRRASPARDEACRRDGGALRLAKSKVIRTAFLFEKDDYGVWAVVRVEAVIVLARCDRCGSRIRVLPYDILPRKLYGLAVIEVLVVEYAEGKKSLRMVAWGVAGNCRCARGEWHVSPMLSDRSGERQRSLAVKGQDLELFGRLTEAYRKVRASRVRLGKIQREILQVFDALEVARRQEGERRYGGRLPAGASQRRSSKKM